MIAYSDLLKNPGSGFAFNLENLQGIEFLEAVDKLEHHLNKILKEIQEAATDGRKVQEFQLGNTFSRRTDTYNPANPDTWTHNKGTATRWKHYSELGYDGVVAFGATPVEYLPKVARRTVHRGGNVAEQYAMALLQRLLHK